MRYVNVKHYKRGAKWETGETRTCTTCRIEIKRRESRGRARPAKVVANLKDGKYKIPVGYCDEHTPEEIK